MREIYIERKDRLLRIAIKDDNKLTDCFIEEDNCEANPGEIYRGIVKNIVPAIKCAFIDIGFEKNCYMYIDKKFQNTNLKKGQELIVEVIKEEAGGKGAKVTNAFSIPGRYSVLMTMNHEISFSSKIKNDVFINEVLKKVEKPDDIGMMIRTNAIGMSIEEISSEFNELYKIYQEVMLRGKHSVKPGLLYSDEGVMSRVLRDSVNDDTVKVIVDSEEDYEYIKNYKKKKGDIQAAIDLYIERRTLFDYFGIEKEILKLRNDKVNLACGGNIVIEKTEAMYVIDVNSGKNVGNNALNKTALVTNLQAAAEIVLQIRLRNLSGIIIIDFIDVKDDTEKQQIINILREGFKNDKNKTVIYPFTELNLVQIARRRRGKNIHEFMEESCKECKGKGKKLKTSYLMMLIKNEVFKVDNEDSIHDIYIEINEGYRETINGDILGFVQEVNGLNKRIYLKFTTLVEYFRVEPLIFANQLQNVEQYKIYG